MTPSTRRAALHALAALALSTTLPAAAQDNRPLEWVVGYAAGGGSDMVARTVAEALGKTLGRTIVITNKPGAATNIAAESVARSKDYGNVMFSADFATLAANPALFSKLSYNAEKDFAPVGLLARFPMLLVVHPSVPAQNWKEFVAWAKSQPNGLNWASAGPGSPHHLAGEMLRERSGLKMNHIPYRGAAPAVQDLLGGQVSVGMMDSASVLQHIGSGKLRAIGVASPQRNKVFASVPTLQEQGLAGYEAYAWQGLVVPTGTPPETVAAFSKALQAALDNTMVKARFHTLALEALPGTPAQMAAYARSERERWGLLIRNNNIRLD
jgi:tripartite-type tricarboxylate transporter receptor subunit TctC